jgi:hypothetical protein
MSNLKSLVWYYFCRYFFKFLPDKLFVKVALLFHSLRFNIPYRLNIKNPKLFHEKVTFLKLKQQTNLVRELADKIAVRKYVDEKIGEKYLVNLLDIYDNANDINFNNLPKKFVLKTNHGSSWNIICNDKDELNFKKTRHQLNAWLKKDPFFLSRESQYNKFPKIICEKYLGHSLIDYKVYCFEGVPKFIQMDFDRFESHRRCFFDTKWVYQDFGMLYDKPDFKISKPPLLEKMIELCHKLSEGLFFVRIDMYIIKNKIYFGEITFFPEGGNCVIYPESMDYIISDNLRLEHFSQNN